MSICDHNELNKIVKFKSKKTVEQTLDHINFASGLEATMVRMLTIMENMTIQNRHGRDVYHT